MKKLSIKPTDERRFSTDLQNVVEDDASVEGLLRRLKTKTNLNKNMKMSTDDIEKN